MNKCWYKLNIDSQNSIRKDFNFTPHTPEQGRWWRADSKNIHTKEWLNYMASIDLPIINSMMFYRGPYEHGRPHIDEEPTMPGRATSFGINYCKGGKGSEMIWYKMPASGKRLVTEKDGTYSEWKDASELEEIDRCHIGEEYVLVRTDIPHVIVMKDDPRWAVSGRTTIKHDIPWDNIVDLLTQKKLLIPRD